MKKKKSPKLLGLASSAWSYLKERQKLNKTDCYDANFSLFVFMTAFIAHSKTKCIKKHEMLITLELLCLGKNDGTSEYSGAKLLKFISNRYQMAI